MKIGRGPAHEKRRDFERSLEELAVETQAPIVDRITNLLDPNVVDNQRLTEDMMLLSSGTETTMIMKRVSL